MLAVPAPAVRLADLEKAVHLVGAANDPAFIFATAMFDTKTLAVRSGDAARYGARLLLLPTAAGCRGGASINFAPAVRTMPDATATCLGTSLAALNVAHFEAATAMPDTKNPLEVAAVVQSLNVQSPLAPCFVHTPSLTAPVSHPAVEQTPLAPCA